jgi:hypothetical protein
LATTTLFGESATAIVEVLLQIWAREIPRKTILHLTAGAAAAAVEQGLRNLPDAAGAWR